jgi:predicted O-methyltransferase YrrM
MNSLRKLARLCGHMVRISFTNPRRISHVLGVALAASDEVADTSVDLLRFPQVTLEDLLPAAGSDTRAILGLLPNTNGSISVMEFVGLILLLKKANAKSVFEFGTYKGVSITQLALNMPENSRIYTLDLPEDDPRSSMPITDPEDIALAREKGKGALVPRDVAPRIQFLKQDSATFDETPFAGQMDLIFVDGAHNADYVRNDSEKAWRMARSGGIVAWHDCRVADPAVVRFLLGCPFRPSRIAGTSLAFAVKP